MERSALTPVPAATGGVFRRLRGAVPVAIYGLWALVLVRPVNGRLTTHMAGSGDAQHWKWLGWRLAERIRAGQNPTRIPDILWPYGSNLLSADGALPAAVVGAWNLVAPAVLAFNLAVLTALVANALAASHLASLFTSRRTLRMLCGLAFASAPAVAIRLEGHYNLLFAFPAPLLVAVAVRAAREEASVKPFRLGLLLAVAYLSSGYYLFFGAVAVAVIVLAGGASWRWRAEAAMRLGAAAAVAVVLLVPFLVPKLQLERRERAAGAVTLNSGAQSFSGDLLAAFLPPRGQTIAVPALDNLHSKLGDNTLEETAFPGALPLLGVAALVPLATRLRRPLLAAAFILWLLSLGPTPNLLGKAPLDKVEWLPMAALLGLPGMAAVRAPNRASFTLAAVAVACLALVLGWTFERLRPKGRAALIVVCVAVLFAGVRPIGHEQEVHGPQVLDSLHRIRHEAQRGDAVLHLPTDCLGNAFEIVLQIEHHLPVIGCQGFDAAVPWKTGLPRYFASKAWAALRCNPGAIGSRPVELPPGFDATPTADAVRQLPDELGARFVVFNRVNECPERGEAVLQALSQAAGILGDDGALVVFDLKPAGRDRYLWP